MQKAKFFLISIIFIVFTTIIGGCNDNQDEAKEKATEEKAATQEKEETDDELALRLAGGRLGSDGLAFIGGGDSNKIWVADAKYHKLVSQIEVEGPKLERTQPYYPNLHDVHAMVFPKDFSVLYTVNWYEYDKPSEVIAYDPKTFKELWRSEAGLGGHHAALTPDDRYLYVANQYADTVSVIDTTTQEKIKDITTGMGNDYISPTMYWDGEVIDSPYLFVSVHEGGKVFAIDWKTHEVVKELTFGGMVHGVNLTPDGKQAWAAVMNENIVPVIDVETLEVVHKIETEQSPIHLSFSPDGKFVYFTTYGDQIFKYATDSYEQAWNVTGKTIPAHTGVSPDGKQLWTLNHGMDPSRYPYELGGSTLSGIQIWNTEDGSLINEIPAHGTPHELQFVPYSAVGVPKTEVDVGQATDEATAQAMESYGKSCLACHGADLTGASGPSLDTVGSRLTKEEIEHIIIHGKGSMPGGLASQEEATLIADWLSQMK
ncbi:c-type cytochrome [Anaerobacillus sp. CMMVII]|uniref:c-type cytochrome n=1 Tax=Anaerobacillus sp. CMMVII TaxID=2755588 RepID=UPI0021B7DF85|nr:c-type cytochrome [Anaerobacillus sp. CMMVII]MCT8140180.1 c-type cytochrome [Anaerobacillus sp. CMMVII]